MTTVMAISAHPDDETIGAGGTLIRHARAGDPVHWCIATQGFQPTYSAAILETATQQVEAASVSLGVSSVTRLGHPTTQLDQIPFGRLVDQLRAVLDDKRPETIYTVGRGDVHSDHRVLFEAVLAAAKPFRSSVRRLLSFECLSSTHLGDAHLNGLFNPNFFVNISDVIGEKLAAVKCFGSELMPPPSPRSLEAVEALARFRGSCVNLHYAEAFVLVREVY